MRSRSTLRRKALWFSSALNPRVNRTIRKRFLRVLSALRVSAAGYAQR